MENVTQEQKETASQVIVAATSLDTNTFNNASLLALTKEERDAIMAPVPIDEIEIRPDGFVYWPQAFYRERLNTVVGIGQWAIIPKEVKTEEVGNNVRVNYVGCLYIRNTFVALATGEHKFITTNANSSLASSTEAAKSDCLVRSCKELSMANEIYKPSFVRNFQREHAVKVFVKNEATNKTETAWRRRDVDPFWNETGLVPTKQTVHERPKTIAPVPLIWMDALASVQGKTELLALYNRHQSDIDQWPELKDAFKKRESEFSKLQAKPQAA